MREVRALGEELSLSDAFAPASEDLQQLAERSHDSSRHRADEPYRRAMIGIYARLTATAKKLTNQAINLPEAGFGRAYDDVEGFLADLSIISDITQYASCRFSKRLELQHLIYAVNVFGFT